MQNACVKDKVLMRVGGGAKYSLLSQDGWLMEGKHNSIAGPRGALVENANLCSFGHSRLKEGVRR